MSDGLAVRRMLEQQVATLERTAAVQQAALTQQPATDDAERAERLEEQLERTLTRLSALRHRLDRLDG